MYYRLIILFLCLSNVALAQEKAPKTSQEIKASTEQLEKNWDSVKREYKRKFKLQMTPIENKIKELKKALDGGDPAKRKEINEEIQQMKMLRDDVRNNFHEITVTSLVSLSSMQKHFINAKDDTKD